MHQYSASELHLIEVMQDQLEKEKADKILVFKRNLTLRSKLFEACLRDKEFDVYFCMSLCI